MICPDWDDPPTISPPFIVQICFFLSSLRPGKQSSVVTIHPKRDDLPTCRKLTNGDGPSRSVTDRHQFGDLLRIGCIGNPPISSPEAVILFVSTKNWNLWLNQKANQHLSQHLLFLDISQTIIEVKHLHNQTGITWSWFQFFYIGISYRVSDIWLLLAENAWDCVFFQSVLMTSSLAYILFS